MKFSFTDILFMVFVGPIPPSMLSVEPPEIEVNDFEATLTEVGAPIPILFGKRTIKEPSLVWYGDVKIKKVKVSTKGKK